MTRSSSQNIAIGSIWAVAMRWSIRLLGITSMLILARLLVPADFGLVAQATLVYGLLELTTDFGFHQALIHNQQADRSDYDTVWTLQVLRGVLISLILFSSAEHWSRFFNEPRLTEIIWVYSGISLLSGFMNVRVTDFRKHLLFDKDFRFHLYKKLVGFFVTIYLAWMFRSYWAMVMGAAASTAAALVIGYAMAPYRPYLDMSRWRHILGFSKWIFGYSLISALSSKIDTFILSKGASTEVLGLYTVAHEISTTPSTEIAQPVARASLPVLSKVNDDRHHFRELNTSTMTMMLFLVLPTCIGLSLVSEAATLVLLGSSWLDAADFIELLALIGIVRTIGAAGASGYIASGNPKMLSILSSIGLVIRASGLGLGFYLAGPIGLCWGALFAACLNGLINIANQHRLQLIDVRLMMEHLWPSAVGVLLMASALHLATLPSSLLGLCSAIVLGGVVHALTVFGIGIVLRQPSAPHTRIINYLLGIVREKRHGA